ncbi:hypothetical protein [Paratractidigestivibacter sp.]|uniref:hypothetical protein n=1 Tax=Paratractidigestivibacter sp. TaxID=2847316 RepID=UPI002AC915CA|nr:hypothetical protein [Paratractidigestivibacter sp.]
MSRPRERKAIQCVDDYVDVLEKLSSLHASEVDEQAELHWQLEYISKEMQLMGCPLRLIRLLELAYANKQSSEQARIIREMVREMADRWMIIKYW